nr:asparagine synthase (glutamine-hydrolyzing) [Halothiobacillus sp.]
MCGITGFWAPDLPSDAAGIAESMAEAIKHRGPDDSGVWIDGEAGIALAHRRLSIIDLSPAGHQPMVSACGRYVLVFNGEIYQHKTLRRRLKDSHSANTWRGHSDTETLLAALAAWGIEETLSELNGMFAFALWDRKDRTIAIARDRVGEKPLYYGWSGGTFLFGSELKALRVHPAFDRPVDRGALTLFMRFGYVPAPHSIYTGIRKLTSGHWLRVRPADGETDAEPRAYWNARVVLAQSAENRLALSDNEATDQLEQRLREAVQSRMEADVPLGAFLSGGYDSSTVVAMMQAQSSRRVRTFSIGNHAAGYDEAQHAKAVGRHLGTEHTELYVSADDALAIIPRLPALYDEPFADSSQIPTFLVSQMTRQHVKVALSGDGGDELFGGYNRYLWGRALWQRLGRWPVGLRGALAKCLLAPSPAGWDRLLRPFAGVLPGELAPGRGGDRLHKVAGLLGVRSAAELYLRLVSLWSDPQTVVNQGWEPGTALSSPMPDAVTDMSERMMLWDLLTYLPDDILTKVDRASMGVSLEARVPLLDHQLVEFAWRLPLEQKIRNGQGKWLLRQVLYRYVPRAMMERPKQGFAVPVEEWLRGPLRDWAEDLLDERRLREEGYLNPGPIRQAWHEHL